MMVMVQAGLHSGLSVLSRHQWQEIASQSEIAGHSVSSRCTEPADEMNLVVRVWSTVLGDAGSQAIVSWVGLLLK